VWQATKLLRKKYSRQYFFSLANFWHLVTKTNPVKLMQKSFETKKKKKKKNRAKVHKIRGICF
jgi:hypothetical protein